MEEVEGEIECDPDPMYDFFSSGFGDLWCDVVQLAKLIVGPEKTPAITSRTILVERKRGEGRPWRRRAGGQRIGVGVIVGWGGTVKLI